MSDPLRTVLACDFDTAVARTTDALRREGFGVLTDVDVQETLRQKVGASLPRYRILGACHPTFAKQAIEASPDAGLMMPCNVIVHATDEGVVVRAVDPQLTARAFGEAALVPLAAAVRDKLARVVAELS